MVMHEDQILSKRRIVVSGKRPNVPDLTMTEKNPRMNQVHEKVERRKRKVPKRQTEANRPG
jgi:hypothetical protein